MGNLDELLELAKSADPADRALAGPELAAYVGDAAADAALAQLILDLGDTLPISETAAALLERRDSAGLRVLVKALALGSEDALARASDAVWSVTEIAEDLDSFEERLLALAIDAEPTVADGAERLRTHLNTLDFQLPHPLRTDPMNWNDKQVAAAVESYRESHRSLNSTVPKAQRKELYAKHGDLAEAVTEAALDGTLPLKVVTALLHDPRGTTEYRAFVAAGPIEDLLRDHADHYAEPIAELCRTDELWARTIGGVWLSEEKWNACGPYLKDLARRNAF